MKRNLPVTDRERTLDRTARIISTTDPKGIITSINNDFLDISGFERDELHHKNHNVVRHPDMPPAAFADLWQTVKSGNTWMGIVKNRCKNGDYYWVDAYVTPIQKNGETIEYQSVRTKPSAERVRRAGQAYQRLSSNKAPFKPGLGLVNKLLIATCAGFIPLFAVLWIRPEFALPAALSSLGLISAAVYWLLAPLIKLANESKQQLNNPLMRFIYTGRTDEIGQLALVIKKNRSELDAVVSRIDFSTKQLAASAAETSTEAAKSSECIQGQGASIERMAHSIAEMFKAIQEVSSNAARAANAADDANAEATKGKGKVNESIAAINALASEVSAAAKVIDHLEEESQAIGSVLDVIRNIAEQTNLLALNAAIEAARAGEQGRGFAVVADEVRTLAQRTQDSIIEIENMVGSVQSAVQKSTQVMQQSSANAQESAVHSNAVSDFLSLITRALNDIAGMTQQIAAASEQQTAVAEEINNNIDTLSENAASVVNHANHGNEISQSMLETTQQLKNLVQEFQRRSNAAMQ